MPLKFWSGIHRTKNDSETAHNKRRNVLKKPRESAYTISAVTPQSEKENWNLLPSSEVEGPEACIPLVQLPTSPPTVSVNITDGNPLQENGPGIHRTASVAGESTYRHITNLVEVESGMYSVITIGSEEYLVYFKQELYGSVSLSLAPGDFKVVDLGSLTPGEESHKTLFVGTRHFLVKIVQRLGRSQPTLPIVHDDIQSISVSLLETCPNQSADALLLCVSPQQEPQPTLSDSQQQLLSDSRQLPPFDPPQEQLSEKMARKVLSCDRLDRELDARSDGLHDSYRSAPGVLKNDGAEYKLRSSGREVPGDLGTPLTQKGVLEHVREDARPASSITVDLEASTSQQPTDALWIPPNREEHPDLYSSYGEIPDEDSDDTERISYPQDSILNDEDICRLEQELERQSDEDESNPHASQASPRVKNGHNRLAVQSNTQLGSSEESEHDRMESEYGPYRSPGPPKLTLEAHRDVTV